MSKKRDFRYSLAWNLLLIVVGSFIQAIGFKAIAAHHGFVPSGLFGVAALFEYQTGFLNAGFWYLLLNIPMFILGYLLITRRFLGYSFVSMMVISLAYMVVDFHIDIQNQLYAAVVFGVIVGSGAGMVLRSLGSNGGLDVVAVILNQRYNIGVGKTYFAFNFVLFSFSFARLDNDLVIASLIAAFVASVSVEYCLSMFNQRKLCLIISNQGPEIADKVMAKLKVGATFLEGMGAYKKEPRRVLMVVTNNIQLKRLEEIAFTTDPHALFIVENTFSVIGSTFSRRKIY
ncbi:YitT family protein [Geoalkalibacter halelectricus]|uniref:YitT family protein n=1 Tax=Geoalkalibacter halelectricus TaxID=2847045 RepID=A0ABY5ZKY3_9BACT|nr:YitT family protein [Geoalkalibacter halelectricus]MDO3378882.1 YitT family protein [Geoalkalibacter halelectricus]UWZ79816.1 YitT family protein [Geoalkalibacter halelectricus]